MFEAEATWLAHRLGEWSKDRLSPLLNVGSGTRHFREVQQPWSERQLFGPLRERGVRLIHLDCRGGDGIDLRADILSDGDLARVLAVRPKAVLCCNILEHVLDPAALARRCIEIVGPGGLIFVTVPHSYPHHRDPIDTLFRPSVSQLAALFHPAEMLAGEIIDVGECYRHQVARRPWILLRPMLRFPFPFIGFQGWRRSMTKLGWLFHNYRITAAVFQVPTTLGVGLNGAVVDSAHPGI